MIPEWMRKELKRPLGRLYSGGCNPIESLKKEMGTPEMLVTVGDVVTVSALKSEISPDLCIVDYRTKREEVSEEVKSALLMSEFEEIRVRNPAGRITSDLVSGIRKGMERKRKVKITVEGEEDLATLPALLLAPEGALILYGQPDEGVVAIKVTREKKEETKDLFRKMGIKKEELDEELKIFVE